VKNGTKTKRFPVQPARKNDWSELEVSGRVDLNRGTVFVEYDENKVSMETMKDAIEYLGYDVN
jgi:hypothetical protein